MTFDGFGGIGVSEGNCRSNPKSESKMNYMKAKPGSPCRRSQIVRTGVYFRPAL